VRSERVRFVNGRGQTLAGRIDLPVTGEPLAFALYAHCFTCGKDLRAIGRISQTLALHGLATLRFDFAGLGESEGEFEETNFSSNVADYLAASAFLAEEYAAPELLIGHSLGGSVAMAAARSVKESRAVVSIAAPSSPAHIKRHIAEDLDEIVERGSARVDLAGRPFTLTNEFISDIESVDLAKSVAGMRRPLLVVHSPIDNTVGIENALEILDNARHPKSFLSLDGADHLISDEEDAVYAAEMIATWATRYLTADLADHSQPDFIASAPKSVTTVRIEGGFRTDVISNGFPLVADEPRSVGGTNAGPTPYDYLLTALGACTAMTLRMYADRKNWPLETVTVQLTHRKVHARDCVDSDLDTGYVDHVKREIFLGSDLDQAQAQRLVEIADRCPVHKTLHGEVVVSTSLGDPVEAPVAPLLPRSEGKDHAAR
jgi:uncharacterized OsmC-like protein/alpha/beta superfamily hydrolase